MRRFLVLAAVGLSLAGCATLPDGKKVFLPTASVQNPVTPQNLADIKATYAIAQTGAVAYIDRYRQGHRCTKTAPESLGNLCSRRSVVLKLQDADRKATMALGRATVFIRDNPTLDASSLISAAQIAVGAFYELQKGQ